MNKWWTTVLHKSNRLQIGRTYLLIDILLFFSIRKSVPTLNAYVYGQRLRKKYMATTGWSFVDREWLFWLQCSMTKIIKMTTTREWNIHDKRLWLHRPFQANYYAVIQFALTVNAPSLRSRSRLSLCIIQKTTSSLISCACVHFTRNHWKSTRVWHLHWYKRR